MASSGVDEEPLSRSGSAACVCSRLGGGPQKGVALRGTVTMTWKGTEQRRMADTRVSVVIPMRNSRDLVAICLRKLCEQTLPPSQFEVIVVDDNSTDGSSEAVQSLSAGFAFAFRLVSRTANEGPGAARNSGIEAAVSPVIALLDADTEPSRSGWKRGFSDGRLRRFEGHTAIGDPHESRHSPIRRRTPRGNIPDLQPVVGEPMFDRWAFRYAILRPGARVHYVRTLALPCGC